MKKILTVIGARPQFVKAAAVSRVIRNFFSENLREIIIHTGQHYDTNMSQVFFDELEIPKPYANLQIGGMSNDEQITSMRLGIKSMLEEIKPDVVLVYGDTNSTHAAALAASDCHLPLVHVEAGLRSFNLSMPEETNRIVADKNSTLLFVPTIQGLTNLRNEGYNLNSNSPYSAQNPGIFHCGDVMFDNALYFSSIAKHRSKILDELGLKQGNFLLVTIHRNNNSDDSNRLTAILRALLDVANRYRLPIILPIHPRTQKMMDALLNENLLNDIEDNDFLRIIPPVSYLDMIQLESNALLILTDSGGVQKEAYFFKKPCLILRSETEWTELVENANAMIADADQERIMDCFDQLMRKTDYTWPSFYGDGNAAKFICETIIEYIN